MEKKIKIVTGKIHSGKTTNLFQFVNNNESVDGILAPIVNKKRKLYHISTRAMKNLEVDEPGENTINVGKYHFINSTFEWANKKLIISRNKNPKWLIVDEIGKLELDSKGLHNSCLEIIKNKDEYDTNIILVIRDYLLEQVLNSYNIMESEYEFLKF